MECRPPFRRTGTKRVGAQGHRPRQARVTAASRAILTSVRGKPGDPDELAVRWTFVVNNDPAQEDIRDVDHDYAGCRSDRTLRAECDAAIARAGRVWQSSGSRAAPAGLYSCSGRSSR